MGLAEGLLSRLKSPKTCASRSPTVDQCCTLMGVGAPDIGLPRMYDELVVLNDDVVVLKRRAVSSPTSCPFTSGVAVMGEGAAEIVDNVRVL